MKPTQIATDSPASEASLAYQSPRAIVVLRKISTAGVVRDAAEQFIAEKWPLSKRPAI